jgi:hypothetical protein
MIKLLVTSPPDRERVVVELWRDDVQIAEVSNDSGIPRIEFYAEPGTNRMDVSLDELEEALKKATENLVKG